MKVQLVAIVCCLVALQVSWGHSYDNILWKVLPLILMEMVFIHKLA